MNNELPLHLKYRPTKFSDMVGNEAVVESLSEVIGRDNRPRTYLFVGPSGCLRRDMPIYDPVEDKTISVYDRWKANRPFNVFSFCPFSGHVVIAPALPPVRYSQDQMFRVETSESVFYVTLGHQFLLDSGEYLSLKELIGQRSGSYRLLSILEPSQTAQSQDVPHWYGKLQGFQENYSAYCHLYDELLPFYQEGGQEFVPLLNDAQAYIYYNRELLPQYNHQHFFVLLSKQGFFLQEVPFDLLLMSQYDAKNFESAPCQTEIFLLALVGTFPGSKVGQFLDPVPGSVSNHMDIYSGLLHKSLLAHCPPFKTPLFGRSIINKIEEIKKDFFYDFHVPFYNNYWAEGLFHHNCGKTTLARIIKNELGCSDGDFREYNSANTRGIDTIREISNNCMYSPMGGTHKIYLLDEAHRQTADAQNALLKLLEDTPKHVIFILCTTDPDKLLQTIKTRCSTYQVKSLQRAKLTILLKKICEKENAEISIKVLNEIVRVVEGCPRKALVYLDQVINIDDEELALQTLIENVTGDVDVREICQMLLKGKNWKQVSTLLKKLDQSPEDTRRQILGYFNVVLLNRTNDRAADLISLFSESFFASDKAGLTLACYLACK